MVWKGKQQPAAGAVISAVADTRRADWNRAVIVGGMVARGREDVKRAAASARGPARLARVVAPPRIPRGEWPVLRADVGGARNDGRRGVGGA
mgnify:CR=1 FL=1